MKKTPTAENPPAFAKQSLLFLLMKLIPDRETSWTSDKSFFPSVLSSVSFTSKSWQLCPEEEGKLRTSASLLHGDVAGILTEGVRVIWQDKPRVLLEYSKKCAAVALARVFRTSFCLLLNCYAWRRWHWNGMSCKTNERGEIRTEREREKKRSQTRDLFGRATCLELAGDAIESDTPGWSCQTATSCPLYSHIAGV